jgi:hypothetical protein
VLFGVTAGIMIAMITQISPICGHKTWMVFEHVVNAERGVMPLEDPEYFRAEPPLITELNGDTKSPRSGRKEFV